MSDPKWKMAIWIAEELDEDVEDVYDVLLGNISEPKDFVNAVHACETGYIEEKRRFLS